MGKISSVSSLVLTSLVLTSLSAFAVSPACQIAQQSLPSNLNMSEFDLRSYQQKIKNECDLSLMYENIQSQYAELGTSLQQVTLYQAMRFVRYVDYAPAKYQNSPIKELYKLDMIPGNIPPEKQATIVWDNWTLGISQLQTEVNSLYSGKAFTVDSLKKVHTGFYQLTDEQSSFNNDPNKGVFKPASAVDFPWFRLRSEAEISEAFTVIPVINDYYKKIGLIDYNADPQIFDVLRIGQVKKKLSDGSYSETEFENAVYSGATKANMTHVSKVLNFMNTTLKAGLQHRPMVYQGRLYTPGEVAFLVQQFYVQVHPFNDGNGRTSRFMQELVLTSMGLPHGASGDLMDVDVLTTAPQYYKRAFESTVILLGQMRDCLALYKENRLNSAVKIRSSSDSIDYSCRLLD